MMKSKIKSLVVLMLIMIIISITGTSRAADYSCKVSLLVNNNAEVKKGESITILVKASEIEAGEGIASFNTIVEYEESLFDITISGDDEGNWQRQGWVENSLSMTRSDLIANSSDQTIAKIVLTAKSDATVGKQTIKLTKMEFSTGNETFTIADVSASITIVEDSNSGDDGNNDNDGNGDELNGNGSSGSGSSGSGSSGSGSSGSGSSGSGSSGSGSSGSGSSGSGSSGSGSSGSGSSGSGSSGSGSSGSGSSGSGSSGSSSSGSSSSGSSSSGSSTNTIPKTGVTDILVVGIILGSVAAVIFYIRYKRAY